VCLCSYCSSSLLGSRESRVPGVSWANTTATVKARRGRRLDVAIQWRLNMRTVVRARWHEVTRVHMVALAKWLHVVVRRARHRCREDSPTRSSRTAAHWASGHRGVVKEYQWLSILTSLVTRLCVYIGWKKPSAWRYKAWDQSWSPSSITTFTS
jgi:hypothetical protein